MTGRPRTLTDAEIRTQFFEVPPLFHSPILDSHGRAEFGARRLQIEATGGQLLMIGWPDGTTITYHRLLRGDPIDRDCIAGVYKASAAMKRVFTP